MRDRLQAVKSKWYLIIHGAHIVLVGDVHLFAGMQEIQKVTLLKYKKIKTLANLDHCDKDNNYATFEASKSAALFLSLIGYFCVIIPAKKGSSKNLIEKISTTGSAARK